MSLPPSSQLDLDVSFEPVSSISPSLRQYVHKVSSFTHTWSSDDPSRRTSEVALCGLEGLPTIPTLSSRHSLHGSTEGSRTVISDDDSHVQESQSGESLTEGEDMTAQTTPTLPTVPLTRETAALELCDPDASLWSRWASSSSDVDVFSTMALLAHTLPDTEQILSRWDEAPFQPRPFSILALPHVQSLLSPPRPQRPRRIPSQLTEDGAAHKALVVDTQAPSGTPADPIRNPDEETGSIASEETEYFSARSRTEDGDNSQLSSPLQSNTQSQSLSQSQYSQFEIIALPKRRMVTPIPRLLARDIILHSGDANRMSYQAPLDQAESDLWLRAQRQLIHRPLIADVEPLESEGGDHYGHDSFDASRLGETDAPRKRWTGMLSLRRLRNSFRSSRSAKSREVGAETSTGAPLHPIYDTPADSVEAIVGPYPAYRRSRTRSKLKKQRREPEGHVVAHPDDLDHVERASITSTPYKIAEWLHSAFNPGSIVGTDTASDRHLGTSIASMPR